MTKNLKTFFRPEGIDTWRSYLGTLIDEEVLGIKDLYSFKSNLGYTLQYLEYLDDLLENQRLHDTVYTLTYKSFVVFGMSVVEGLLFYVIGKSPHQDSIKWKEIETFTSNGKVHQGKNTRVKNIIEEELVEPELKHTNLSKMINKVVKKKLIPSDSRDLLYKNLSNLRKLRNKVHIHDVDGSWDTDWNSFNRKQLNLTKEVLHGVLSSELFEGTNETKILDFLKIKKE